MSHETDTPKPAARAMIKRWLPELESRAGHRTAWRWKVATVRHRYLAPAFLVARSILVAVVAITLVALFLSTKELLFTEITACLWLSGRAYHSAVLWLQSARFSTTTRVWLALPDSSHRAWFSAGWHTLSGFVSLGIEAAGLGLFLALSSPNGFSTGLVLGRAGLVIAGSLGAVAWLLLAASLGKKFALPLEASRWKKVIAAMVTLGFLILFVADEIDPVIQIAVLGRWLHAVPPIGWAIGHPDQPLAIVAVSAIPWVFMPWIARRFRQFAERNHIALLTLQWKEPWGKAASSTRSQPAQFPGEESPAGGLEWPPPRVPLPRWAFLDRLFLAMLTLGERRASRLFMVNTPAPLTQNWSNGAIVVLIALVVIGMLHPRWEALRDDWATPLGFLFFLAGLVVLGLMLSGDHMGPLMKSDGRSRSSYPFFTGFPVALRDLVFLEWKLAAVRVVAILPVILGYIAGVNSLFQAPEGATFMAMFTLAGLIGILATRPAATIRRLRNATVAPNTFSATFWWFSVSGIGLVAANALIVLVGIQFGLREPLSLPFPALALGIGSFFHWIIFHSAYNRGETSLEPRLVRSTD